MTFKVFNVLQTPSRPFLRPFYNRGLVFHMSYHKNILRKLHPKHHHIIKMSPSSVWHRHLLWGESRSPLVMPRCQCQRQPRWSRRREGGGWRRSWSCGEDWSHRPSWAVLSSTPMGPAESPDQPTDSLQSSETWPKGNFVIKYWA